MKTERDTTHDWERSAHGLEWATALAFPHGIGRLSRRPPVALIRRLLDVYITYTAAPMVLDRDDGPSGDLDPTGGFRRARPAAMELRTALENWDGALPLPADVVAAARAMVTAYGHPAAGQWEEHTFPDDAEEALVWPDETTAPGSL
jgi:hypothetical protein